MRNDQVAWECSAWQRAFLGEGVDSLDSELGWGWREGQTGVMVQGLGQAELSPSVSAELSYSSPIGCSSVIQHKWHFDTEGSSPVRDSMS